jgi:hypothetical protein
MDARFFIAAFSDGTRAHFQEPMKNNAVLPAECGVRRVAR